MEKVSDHRGRRATLGLMPATSDELPPPPATLPADLSDRLRPGLRILRRDATYLQIGLTPHTRSAPVDPTRVQHDDWRDHPALVTLPSLERVPAHGPERALQLGLLATYVDAQDHRRAARASASVGIEGPNEWSAPLAGLLTAAGVGAHVVAVDGPTATEQVRVVLAAGEVSRERFDALAAEGTPALPIAVIDGAVRVGPLVVRGLTACLRCVDAHLAGDDPRWPLLVEQYVGPDARYGAEPLCDPAVRDLALAWASADVVRWFDGAAPRTWSQTWWFGAATELAGQSWNRHPHCGCTWADFLATG